MLRLVFDRQDLLRVRLAGGADPMWELVLSVQMAQTRGVPPPFMAWRQEFDRRFTGADRGKGAMSLLRFLITPVGSVPDFLTAPGPVTDLDAGCEAVLLAGGDRARMGEVVEAIRHGHDLLLAPHWGEVRNTVAADRAMRARQLAAHGVGALLANLPGVLSWDGRVLCARYPEDRTIRLNGRGLVLLPSYFCWGDPITWLDPQLPPVLVYQALNHDRAELTVSPHLVALIGRTRAECLRILLTPRTTTELAQHLGASVGTASKQAAVLRDNGLVTSNRRGATVLHSTTSLGAALLTTSTAPHF